MTRMEINFYEAGIKDANEARRIIVACKSKRYAELSGKYQLRVGKESLKCLNAYNKGVAYEINRQAMLEF